MNLNDNTIKVRPFKLQGVPFCWQDVRIMTFIRNNYEGKKLTTAKAIYQTYTELASIAGRGKGRHTNQFPAYYETIACWSGKSVSTIKRYAKDFRKFEILDWKTQKKGKMNLANLWILLAYSGQNSNPTSQQNKSTNPEGQNNDPLKKEDVRKFIKNKERSNNFRTNNGPELLKDIIPQKYKRIIQ
ncbi:hypothetical protein ACFL06_01560 [Patescibacteria group bacterium]